MADPTKTTELLAARTTAIGTYQDALSALRDAHVELRAIDVALANRAVSAGLPTFPSEMPLGVPLDLQHPAARAFAKATREEQLHGPLLKDISELDALVADVDAAAKIARSSLQSTMNIDGAAFEKLVGPIERRPNAPWLVNVNGVVLRVFPEKRGTAEFQRAATDSGEIRRCVF